MTATNTPTQGITRDEYIADLYNQATELTKKIDRLKGEAQYAREQGNLDRMTSYLHMLSDYSHDLGLTLGILIGLGKQTF